MKMKTFFSCFFALLAGFTVAVQGSLADSEFDENLNGSDGSWGWKPPRRDRGGSGDGGAGSGHMNSLEDDSDIGDGDCGGNCGGRRGGRLGGLFGGGALAGGSGFIPLLVGMLGGGRGGITQPNGFFPGLNNGFGGGSGFNGFGAGSEYGLLPATPTVTPTATATPTPTLTPTPIPTVVPTVKR